MITKTFTAEMITTIGASLVANRRYSLEMWVQHFERDGIRSEFWANEIRETNDAHYALHYGTSIVD